MERIPKIRVSTESRPWRRKFSRRSSRDSNPRPFHHESGALTTELSPPPLVTGVPFNLFNAVLAAPSPGKRPIKVPKNAVFLSVVVELDPIKGTAPKIRTWRSVLINSVLLNV